MIIDGFMLFDELDLLECRLEYLNDVVDKFIIVEADTSYMGRPKPYNFYNNMSRYSKYLDKIIYYPMRHDPYRVPYVPVMGDTLWWRRENDQRMEIGRKLDQFSDDDIIMVSDIDEIPLKKTVLDVPEYLKQYNHISMKFFLYYYNFNQGRYPWNSTIASTVKVAKELNTQRLKHFNAGPPYIEHAGYHVSYFFPAERIKNKIQNAAHPEMIHSETTELENIKNRVKRGSDLFTRFGNDGIHPSDPKDVDPEFYSIFSKLQYFGI